MTFRDATVRDLDALLALENACYPPNQAYSREEYRYSLVKAKAINILWEENGEATGFIGAFHHRAWRVGHLYTINVHPKERGKGLGIRLMDECHRRLKELGMTRAVLEVNVENAGAIRLYEKCGYRLVQRMPDYYTQYANNDAFLYERGL